MAGAAPSYVTTQPSWQREKRQTGFRFPSGKKNNPLAVVLLVAIVALCGSAIFRITHSQPKTTFVKVVVAAESLPAGVTIDFAQLRFLDVPRDLVSRDMIYSLKDVVGHEARTYIGAGQPIRSNMIFSAMGGLSRNLAPNERALTLQLNDDTLVDHSIRPDDCVDVLAVSAKNSAQYTKTICQSARVLLAAPKEQILARRLDHATFNKVTIAVTPELAEKITEAAETSKIRLILRAKTSHEQIALDGADQDDLLPHSAFKSAQAQENSEPAMLGDGGGNKDHAAATAPPPPAFTSLPAPPLENPIEWLVQVFSGNHKETISVGQK
ncbi:MAG TPA: Flp pilus assembly protein CpaB [Candidatus Obscuribacterales bacterium]